MMFGDSYILEDIRRKIKKKSFLRMHMTIGTVNLLTLGSYISMYISLSLHPSRAMWADITRRISSNHSSGSKEPSSGTSRRTSLYNVCLTFSNKANQVISSTKKKKKTRQCLSCATVSQDRFWLFD